MIFFNRYLLLIFLGAYPVENASQRGQSNSNIDPSFSLLEVMSLCITLACPYYCGNTKKCIGNLILPNNNKCFIIKLVKPKNIL